MIITILRAFNDGGPEPLSAGAILRVPPLIAAPILAAGAAVETPAAVPSATHWSMAGGLAEGTNLYGIQAPVIESEPAIAGPTVAAPICTAIETIASDGDGTGNTNQDWAGMMRGLMVRMTDGTLFAAYIQKNAGVNRLRLMRSPTGGPNGSAWTQVTTIATDMMKSIVLRDRSRDHVVWVTAEGTDPNYSIKLRRFDSAGNQVGSAFTVNTAGRGIMQMMRNTGFYYEASIDPMTSRVVLAGWTQPLPVAVQPDTTITCYKQVQWVLPDGDSWIPEKVVRWPTEQRGDYDNIAVGANGDPDQAFGVMQGNLAMWEAIGRLYGERLPPSRLPGYYTFNRIGVWWHNRRTGHRGHAWVSPDVPWMIRPWDGDGSAYNAANDIPEVRTKTAIMHVVTGDWWIPYHVNRPQPYAPGITATASISGNTLTVTAILTPAASTPLSIGTTITGHSLATTGFVGAKIIALGTGTGGAGTYILDTHVTLASGTVQACNPANPSTSQAAVMSHRVMIVSPRGEVRWDGEITNGVGYGNVTLEQNAQGRVWAILVALGGIAAQTQFHMWELVQDADGGLSGSTTLTAANCYNSNNLPVAGNVGFGTWSTYLGGPQTLPARAANQGAIVAALHHGSRPSVSRFEVLISRRATDHNGSSTATTVNDSTAHKMDLMSFSVPA